VLCGESATITNTLRNTHVRSHHQEVKKKTAAKIKKRWQKRTRRAAPTTTLKNKNNNDDCQAQHSVHFLHIAALLSTTRTSLSTQPHPQNMPRPQPPLLRLLVAALCLAILLGAADGLRLADAMIASSAPTKGPGDYYKGFAPPYFSTNASDLRLVSTHDCTTPALAVNCKLCAHRYRRQLARLKVCFARPH